MSMTVPGLSAVIKSNLENVFGVPPDETKLIQFCDALSQALVTYIQANATVTITAHVDTPVLDNLGHPTTSTVSFDINSTGHVN